MTPHLLDLSLTQHQCSILNALTYPCKTWDAWLEMQHYGVIDIVGNIMIYFIMIITF